LEIYKRIIHPHSQAQLQFAQAKAHTKNCNRACLSASAFLPTLKTNFFGNGSASIEWINDCKILIIN
jgi:hypothetical protein